MTGEGLKKSFVYLQRRRTSRLGGGSRRRWKTADPSDFSHRKISRTLWTVPTLGFLFSGPTRLGKEKPSSLNFYAAVSFEILRSFYRGVFQPRTPPKLFFADDFDHFQGTLSLSVCFPNRFSRDPRISTTFFGLPLFKNETNFAKSIKEVLTSCESIKQVFNGEFFKGDSK